MKRKRLPQILYKYMGIEGSGCDIYDKKYKYISENINNEQIVAKNVFELNDLFETGSSRFTNPEMLSAWWESMQKDRDKYILSLSDSQNFSKVFNSLFTSMKK